MLSDMVPTGFYGAELADVQYGDEVLVIGIGPVGLMAVAGANLHGASRIYAVGTRPVCIEAAKFYGGGLRNERGRSSGQGRELRRKRDDPCGRRRRHYSLWRRHQNLLLYLR